MAEKVIPAGTGSIAARTSTFSGDVQFVDIVHERIFFSYSSPTRIVSGSDSPDLSAPMTGDILSTALDSTGAMSTLLVGVLHAVNSINDMVVIQPIGIDADDNPLPGFYPKTFMGFKQFNAPAAININESEVLTPWQTWQIWGCSKVGIHVTLDGPSSAKIFAAMVTGPGDAGMAAAYPDGGEWSGWGGGA